MKQFILVVRGEVVEGREDAVESLKDTLMELGFVEEVTTVTNDEAEKLRQLLTQHFGI